MTQLVVGHLADKGLERDHQEDAYAFYLRPPEPAAAQGNGALLVVADGVGGRQAGEVASRMAVSTVLERYYASPGDDVLQSLHQAIVEANRAIHEAAQAPGREKMASTVVCAAIRDDALFMGHVGDSRAYLLRGGALSQLTQDHSLVAELLRRGAIRPEEVARHPQRHVITRALGSGAQVEPEVKALGRLKEGDRLLLCTDGLYDSVDARQIRDCLARGHPQIVCQALVDLAKRAGGSDNITVIVAEVHLEQEAAAPSQPARPAPAQTAATPPPEATAPAAREQAQESGQPDLATREQALLERQSSSEAAARALQEREAALASREQGLGRREQAAQAAAASLAAREQDLGAQQLAQRDRQSASDAALQALGEREAALIAKEQELAAREQALLDGQSASDAALRALGAREATLIAKEQDLAAREQALLERQAGVDTASQALDERQAALASREQELAAREQAQLGEQAAGGLAAQALAERQAALDAQEHSLIAQERSLLEQQTAVDTTMQALQEREAALVAREQAPLDGQPGHSAPPALQERESALAAEEQRLAALGQAVEAREAALAAKERSLIVQERALLDRQAAIDAAAQALAEREAACAAGQEQARSERQRAADEREAALQEREQEIARWRQTLEQERARSESDGDALKRGWAQVHAQRQQLQAEQERLADERTQFRRLVADFRQRWDADKDRLAAWEAELNGRATRLSQQEVTLRAREQRLAQAEPATLERTAPRMLRPVGQPIYQAACEISYEASAAGGDFGQEKMLEMPGGGVVVCGMIVRREHLRRQYPVAVEIWAGMRGNRASRLLVGYGLNLASMPVANVEGYDLAVIVKGNEVIGLRAGQMQVRAALTRCEFASVARHHVTHDHMAFVGLAVRFSVEVTA